MKSIRLVAEPGWPTTDLIVGTITGVSEYRNNPIPVMSRDVYARVSVIGGQSFISAETPAEFRARLEALR